MIVIEEPAEKIMYDEAVKIYPEECCGFLFGYEDVNGNRRVTLAMPVHNSSGENKKRHFVIAAKDYMNAEKYAIENDLSFLGIYHSHPDHPAEPSERDRLSAQPWFSYVIISVAADGVKRSRSWALNDHSYFDEEEYQSFQSL